MLHAVDTAPRKRPRKGRPGVHSRWTPTAAAVPLALTVLVIDDLEDAREMYKRFLEFRGVRVITAADGMAALAVLERHRLDAIVIDLARRHATVDVDKASDLKG